jgi:hypothetical protein
LVFDSLQPAHITLIQIRISQGRPGEIQDLVRN